MTKRIRLLEEQKLENSKKVAVFFGPWDDLPADIWGHISQYIGNVLDIICLYNVCTWIQKALNQPVVCNADRYIPFMVVKPRSYYSFERYKIEPSQKLIYKRRLPKFNGLITVHVPPIPQLYSTEEVLGDVYSRSCNLFLSQFSKIHLQFDTVIYENRTNNISSYGLEEIFPKEMSKLTYLKISDWIAPVGSTCCATTLPELDTMIIKMVHAYNDGNPVDAFTFSKIPSKLKHFGVTFDRHGHTDWNSLIFTSIGNYRFETYLVQTHEVMKKPTYLPSSRTTWLRGIRMKFHQFCSDSGCYIVLDSTIDRCNCARKESVYLNDLIDLGNSLLPDISLAKCIWASKKPIVDHPTIRIVSSKDIENMIQETKWFADANNFTF